MPSLPLVSLVWTTEDTIIAAGHDCQPFVFNGTEGGWQEAGTLDDQSGGASGGTARRGGLAARSGAFAAFQAADSRGLSGSSGAGGSGETKLTTVHQNTITGIRIYDGAPGQVSRVSTSGVDGNLAIWDVNAVSAITGRLGGMSVR